jgi:hypothetical protein
MTQMDTLILAPETAQLATDSSFDQEKARRRHQLTTERENAGRLAENIFLQQDIDRRFLNSEPALQREAEDAAKIKERCLTEAQNSPKRKAINFINRRLSLRTIALDLGAQNHINSAQLAEELMSRLEQSGSGLIFQYSPRLKTQSHEANYELNYRIKLKPESVLSKVDNPLIAVERIQALFGARNDRLLIGKGEELLDLLNQLCAVPTEKFDIFLQTLSRFRHIRLQTFEQFAEFHPDIKIVVEALVQGKESELLTACSIHERYANLLDYTQPASILYCLENVAGTQQRLTLAHELLRAASEANNRNRQEDSKFDRYHLSKIMDFFQENQLFDTVEQIIGSGVGIGPDTLLMLDSRYRMFMSDLIPSPQRVNEGSEVKFPTFFSLVTEVIRNPEQLQQVFLLAGNEPVNTDNILWYFELSQFLIEANQQIETMDDYSRLSLIKGVNSPDRLSDRSDTDVWRQLSPHHADAVPLKTNSFYPHFALIVSDIVTNKLLSKDGVVSKELIKAACEAGNFTNSGVVDYLDENEQPFYRYIITLPPIFRHFVLQRRDEFDKFYYEGQETRGILTEFASFSAETFINYLNKEKIAIIWGDEFVAPISQIFNTIPIQDSITLLHYLLDDRLFPDMKTVLLTYASSLVADSQALPPTCLYLLFAVDSTNTNTNLAIISQDSQLKNLVTGDPEFIGSELDFQSGQTLLSSTPLGKKMDRHNYARGKGREAIISVVASAQVNQFRVNLPHHLKNGVDGNNWLPFLSTYIATQSDEWRFNNFDSNESEQVTSAFESTEAKNICYSQIKNMYLDYLRRDGTMPISLFELTELTEYCGGAGFLKHIEALSHFVHQLNNSLTADSTAPANRQQILGSLLTIENRFVKERWDAEQMTQFYQISSDFLTASPSLFSEFATLFTSLGRSEIPQFLTSNYPIYQARLAVIQDTDQYGNNYYSPRELAIIRKSVRKLKQGLSQDIENRNSIFQQASQETNEEIKILFRSRFGIKSVPEEMSGEVVRSIQNIIRYRANISKADQQSESLLGFYLALMIHGKWLAFKAGEPIDPADYLDGEKAILVTKILNSAIPMITAELIGLSDGEEIILAKELQQPEEVRSWGTVKTVDELLEQIVISLEDLVDPDAYNNPVDKSLVALYVKHGVKPINTVLSKTFQELNGKQPTFAQDERSIQDEIRTTMENSAGISWTQEGVASIQARKEVATVVKIWSSSEKINPAVQELRDRLVPPSEVIRVFRSLNETEFSTESGAFALAQDLSYLEELVSKHQNDITEPDRLLVSQYLNRVREQLIILQSIYDDITKKIDSTLGQLSDDSESIIRARLLEIQRVIRTSESLHVMVTHFTGELNDVIENIRACLGCLSKEVNNDTNLSFGAQNRFFITSKAEHSKSSVSDQLVFFEPLELVGEHSDQPVQAGMAFVMDRMYGAKSVDILESHIAVLVKKLRRIKQQFPESTVSVVITDATLSSVGISSSQLIQRIETEEQDLDIKFEDKLIVNVLPIPMGDQYIEFGRQDARKTGKRDVSGIVLKMAA